MDSKNIKDYLHLYLGQQCRCYNHADREGWLETISCTIIIEYGDEDSEIEGIVPILRPLSDMTDEEIRELFKHDEISKSYLNISYQKEIVMNNVLTGITINYDTITPDGTFSNSWTLRFSAMNAHDCKWLMSKGFDLFGLIDAGLAIKKSQ